MSRFVICRASAGSGKTYTLVRQFIEIAISSSYKEQIERNLGQILAITFTNKAANGMKDRIMSQLHAIVVHDKKSAGLVNDICRDLSIADDEVVRRCGMLLSAILHNYSKFSVCTIDSFVHRLVRTFAHDLNLPMNFNVQTDQQEILQNVVDELLSLAGNPKETALTRLLCAFTESRMEGGKGYNMESTLQELSKEVMSEDSPKFLPELEKINLDEYIAIYDRIANEIASFEHSLSSDAAAFVDDCSSKGLDVDSFPYKGNGVLAFFCTVAKGDFSKINNPHKRMDEAYKSGHLYAKSTSQQLIQALDSVMDSFRKAYESMVNGLSRYNTNRLLLGNLYGLALLGRINAIKNDYYDANEIVHISEFNKRIDKEVANEPAPFIYERIGNRYHNYLIDEFQDTSRLQWLNFLPLLDEAMTYDFPETTPEPGTQSLVVGDGKQAIYRFRQGDVRQFVRLPEVESSMHGGSLKREAHFESLTRNYRTLSNIVEFNNRFFNDIITGRFAENDELQKLYIGKKVDGKPELVQETVKEGGYAQFDFVAADDLLPQIFNTIRHQVDDMNYSYGDIMVLARDNDSLVHIADYLTINSLDRPIPIVSSESFVLTNSPVVLLLQSLLEYTHNPKDRVAALQSLQLACRCGCIAGELQQPSPLWQLQQCGFDLAKMLSHLGIDFNIDRLRSLSLYDCCEEMLRVFHLDGKDSAYVATFLNTVASYMQHSRPDLQGLIKFLDERIAKLSRSTASDLDAVQLLTIHKAKGLEKKIVIYAIPYKEVRNSRIWVRLPEGKDNPIPVAFVNLQSIPTDFKDDFDKERTMNDVDRVNVLYVAMTRSEEKLFVCCEDVTSSDSFVPLLKDFVGRDEKCVQLSESRYAVGEDFINPGKAADDDEKQTHTMPVDDVCFPQWENRVRIASQSDALLSSLEKDSRRYGIVVHDLMSRINVPEDVAPVVDEYCREHHIVQRDAESILRRITDMVNSPENRRYFDPHYSVRCEASIAVGGEVRRPDRIVYDDKETFVVDFKTGTYNEETHRKYQRQVAEYADALTAMGFPNVKAVIIYL